jgi:tetratricopeptide (TPR) repeat protein
MQVRADALEKRRHEPVLLREERGEQVLGQNLLVVALTGDRLRILKTLLCLDCKLVEFHAANVRHWQTVASLPGEQYSMDDLAQARAALKAGKPREAVEFYQRAEKLAPRDPELPHERGLAHLELGEVGLAAFAQGEALALDPEHTGARAQRAAALEALGDDEGAASELRELLARIGPQIGLQARLAAIEESARRAASRRLVGNSNERLSASPLIGTALARTISETNVYRAPFAELRADVHGGSIERLDLVFDSMDASLARSDLSYGGTTEDEDGRRVPLDEFTAAGVVFLSESVGIEPLRARRVLQFLLTPECGMGPVRIAGCSVGWTVSGANGGRRYGIFVSRTAA